MTPPVNQLSDSYDMNVAGAIIITEGQKMIMEVLRYNPLLTNPQIALQLGKKTGAIQTHIVDLYYRSGAKTRKELIGLAPLMVVADRRGGNTRPMMLAHKAGRAFI